MSRTLNEGQMEQLREWLDNREYDIESGWEDFGYLREVFVAVFGREPRAAPNPTSNGTD